MKADSRFWDGGHLQLFGKANKGECLGQGDMELRVLLRPV